MKRQTLEKRDKKALGWIRDRLNYIRSDIEILMESRCATHGRGGNGPSFTACLLALIGAEAAGEIFAPLEFRSTRERTQWFFSEVAMAVGDQRYRECAGALTAFFRDGIAHAFSPKEVRLEIDGQTVTAGCGWIQDRGTKTTHCWKVLQSKLVNPVQRRRHLRTGQRESWYEFVVLPQILCRDVDIVLKRLQRSMARADVSELKRLAQNERRLSEKQGHYAREALAQGDKAFLLGEGT